MTPSDTPPPMPWQPWSKRDADEALNRWYGGYPIDEPGYVYHAGWFRFIRARLREQGDLR